MHVVNSMSTTPVAVSGLVLSRARESTAIWISTRLKYQLAKPDQAQSFTVEVKKGTRKVTGVDVTARVTSSHLPPIDIQLVKQRAGNLNLINGQPDIHLTWKRNTADSVVDNRIMHQSVASVR
jgi:hypothetical protein